MNIRIVMTTLLFLSIISCSKQEPQPTPTVDSNVHSQEAIDTSFDGKSIPKAIATWKLHYQGGTTADTNSPAHSFFDTGFHYYITISATDRDTVIYPKYQDKTTYRVYETSYHVINDRLKLDHYKILFVYARYDEPSNTMRYFAPYNNTGHWYDAEDKGVDFDTKEQPGKPPVCAPLWYKNHCTVVTGAPISINGKEYPALYMQNGGNKYFYQAVGIGGIHGPTNCPGTILPMDGRSILRSMVYEFGKDKYVFDYPYVE